MTPQHIGQSLVYGLMGGYCLFVLYLIAERIFRKEERRGKVKLDAVLLAEAVYRDMYPKREPDDEGDADYSALTLEETTSQEAA